MYKDFYAVHTVRTGSVAHPVSTGARSPRPKRPEREPDHCPPSAQVKNGGAIPPVLIRHHGVVLKDMGKFTFTLTLFCIKSAR